MVIDNDRGESTRLENVLVGEVWFASGQSNMVWTAGKSMCQDLARELSRSTADVPIREISIDTVSALYPQRRATSVEGWKTHRSAGNFSALALAFAHELYAELDVPIGILLSAHSNTRIEAFTQREAIEGHPQLASDADLIRHADPLTPQGQQAYRSYHDVLRDWQQQAAKAAIAGGRLPNRPGLPGIAGMWRGPSQFFNGKIYPVVPYAIRGAIWCQGTSNSGDGRIYAARMEALVNGWRAAWQMPDMPFYFTQMQCYGSPDPDSVGFADIRQVQQLFFERNRSNVGMVVQTDLNSARPQGIHYFNKLHPGQRMARWALANEYQRDVPFTGPIFSGYQVEGERVVVSFEPESLFGGLMVGSKGFAKDYREPERYVEPALSTPGEELNHFRLCGSDHQWFAAQAVIVDDQVVVTSPQVRQPVGVQYAYNAVPENSNLYNAAGLPATPFAQIDHQYIFEEDDLAKQEALKARYAQYTDPNYPILQVVEYFRDGAIIQRDHPIPVWGHANEGVSVKVTLGNETKETKANALQQWSVTFDPRPASSDPIQLTVEANHGHRKEVRDILVGDVWYLTGSTLLNGEMASDPRKTEAAPLAPLPLVREFRRKTAASSFPTPRKRKFETGGGKYRSSWMTADFKKPDQGVTMFAYHFAKTLDRPGIPQGFITMSSGNGGRARQLASPLSWTSFAGVAEIKRPEFRDRLNELFLQYPNTDVARRAVDDHLQDVRRFVDTIQRSAQSNTRDRKSFPLAAPAFPEPGKNEQVPRDTLPTYAYNWCVSPMTPMAIAGVVWVPSEHNLGEHPREYGAELEIYAKSLPSTYGSANVPFYYAQPSPQLVEGISAPELSNANSVTFDVWPKSLREIAVALAECVPKKNHGE